jgi:RNA polymerase sigma-70 factor (ECF subfamily)
MKNQDLNKEKELLENAQSDSKKFDALYKYYVDDVYRFSYSILNNRHDAEDITSQTFIEFYKKLQSYKWQNVSLKYWFFTTCKNLCYTKFRRKSEIEYKDEIHSMNFAEVSFVDEIMNRDLLEKVKAEIQKLSPAEQELINLRIWEGMQFNEIAKLEGVKLGTCKVKFYRAIEKVKKSLEEKHIMHAIAFPFLFTAIRDVGNLETYHASAKLLGAGVTIILGKTAMTTLGNLITSIQAALATKVGTAAIIATTTVAAVGGGYVAYEAAYKEPRRDQVTTQAPTWIEYSDADLGIAFKYPSDFKLEKVENIEDKEGQIIKSVSLNILGDDDDSQLSIQRDFGKWQCEERLQLEDQLGGDYNIIKLDSGLEVANFNTNAGGAAVSFKYDPENRKTMNGQPAIISGCYFPLETTSPDGGAWSVSYIRAPLFMLFDFMTTIKSIHSIPVTSNKYANIKNVYPTPEKAALKPYNFKKKFVSKAFEKSSDFSLNLQYPENYGVKESVCRSSYSADYECMSLEFIKDAETSLRIDIVYVVTGVGGLGEARKGELVVVMKDGHKVVRQIIGNDDPSGRLAFNYNQLYCDTCKDSTELTRDYPAQEVAVSIDLGFSKDGFLINGYTNVLDKNDLLELENILRTIEVK